MKDSAHLSSGDVITDLQAGDQIDLSAIDADITLAAFGNTRSYGGGMPMCPGADPADGLFDVTHVAPIGRAKLVRLFPLLLRGQHLTRSEVTSLRTAELEVDAPGLVVYADGERVGVGRARFRVVPGALTVLVPDDGRTETGA